jgi:hypothetical protein
MPDRPASQLSRTAVAASPFGVAAPSRASRSPSCGLRSMPGYPAIRSSRRGGAMDTTIHAQRSASAFAVQHGRASVATKRRRALHPSTPSTSPLTPYLNTLDLRHPRRHEALASLPHLQRRAGRVPGGGRGAWERCHNHAHLACSPPPPVRPSSLPLLLPPPPSSFLPLLRRPQGPDLLHVSGCTTVHAPLAARHTPPPPPHPRLLLSSVGRARH